MADQLGSSTVDNGFEKVEALASGQELPEEEPTSTTTEAAEPEADLYASSEAQSKPPQDLDEAAPVAEPQVTEAPVPPDSPSPPEGAADEKGDATGWLKNVDPREHESEVMCTSESCVIELIYWRDIKKTGIVFGSMMILLISLVLFSVLSVVAYLSLAALTVTVSFVVYKKVLQAVQKTGDGHPFKQYLDMDIDLTDRINELAVLIGKHAQCTVKALRRLFLVEDIVDSLKFGLLLWVLTYIGAWFNGMTLIILSVLGLFTLPKVYETYQVQIDHYCGMMKTQVETVMKQLQEKIPMPGKKKQS